MTVMRAMQRVQFPRRVRERVGNSVAVNCGFPDQAPNLFKSFYV